MFFQRNLEHQNVPRWTSLKVVLRAFVFCDPVIERVLKDLRIGEEPSVLMR